jgi:hypothetical protein
MTVDAEVPAVAPPPAKPSRFGRIIGALVSPGTTMVDIARRPDFAAPLILIVVLSLLGGVLMTTKVDFRALAHEQIEASGRASQMSPEQMEKQERFVAAFSRVVGFVSPLLSVIILVIVAAILLAAFKLMGGDGDFLQAFSITTYSWLPLLVKSVLAWIVIVSKRHGPTMQELQNPIASNLGFFVSAKAHPVLASFLASFDVFSLWMIVLLVIGFAAMSRFSRAKSAAIIVVLWVVKVFFTVAFASVGALMGRRA